jgi:hypothetical protein
MVAGSRAPTGPAKTEQPAGSAATAGPGESGQPAGPGESGQPAGPGESGQRSGPGESGQPAGSAARTADQRRADALVDLVLGRRRRAPATVHVTVPLATLLRAAEHPGELAGFGPVPATMARRLAADGVWRWLATSDQGAVVDVGRRRYRPPTSLANLVRGRDVTCRFPGCRQPAHRCDLDHTVPYPAGPTSAANLTSLCRHHHLLKHRAGWIVRQHGNADVTWTSPADRSYTTRPPTHPPRAPRTGEIRRGRGSARAPTDE